MWMILEEMKSGDIDEIGRYVFASYWTDKNTNDDKKLFPKITKTNDEGNTRLDSRQLELCKRKCWEFQQEWRHLIYN